MVAVEVDVEGVVEAAVVYDEGVVVELELGMDVVVEIVEMGMGGDGISNLRWVGGVDDDTVWLVPFSFPFTSPSPAPTPAPLTLAPALALAPSTSFTSVDPLSSTTPSAPDATDTSVFVREAIGGGGGGLGSLTFGSGCFKLALSAGDRTCSSAVVMEMLSSVLPLRTEADAGVRSGPEEASKSAV